ncbi:MAG: hypothetical protein K2X10_00960 [Hyphomicrobiales bacterium]|nr:hypothetical protein [Hyphomicrobiales bacterium]OQW85309.1 MAG: hypothetical protein BVN31_00355 [Proteobacteria bacterium ST_bin15]
MKIIFPLACLSVLAGCTPYPKIEPKSLRFLSEPEGAVVTISTTGASCVTPCALQFTSIQSFTANFAKPGFASQSVLVASATSTSIVDGFTPSISIGPVQISGPDNYDRGRFQHSFIPDPVSVRLNPAQ